MQTEVSAARASAAHGAAPAEPSTISGGTVTAIGKDGGAGIGGGQGSNQTGGVGYDGGTVIISGGTVYASNGGTEARDIGYGLYGSGGTLTLSGSAAVFPGIRQLCNPHDTRHANAL